MMAFFFTSPISSSTPMTAITDRSSPNGQSVRKAPSAAAGRPDRMVSGWIRLSYSTPSTT